MAPKIAKKAEATPKKAAVVSNTAPKTPKSTSTANDLKTPAPEDKKSPAKRAKVEHESHPLPNTGAAPNCIQVMYDNSPDAKASKTGYSHIIKLSGTDSFKLIGTTTLTEGEFKGRQVIILQPPQSFEVMNLTPEIRQHIYDFYFACKGVVDDPIALEAKRKSTGEPWAKAYAEGSKYRVALLAASKALNEEASPVLYAKAIRVGEPTALLNFLGILPQSLTERLRHIKIVQYKSATTKVAMNFLAKAKNIVQLEIENGVATAVEPAKAAEVFYGDIRVLVEAITATLKEKTSTATKLDALDVIRLGREALAVKEKKYSKEEREQFMEALRAKVK